MRQAGRYLPEYRKLREQAGDFLTLCKTPELACAATLQPLARFPVDAAILFSDILTIPDAMGLGLSMTEGVGPRFAKTIRNEADVETLPVLDPEVDLAYVMETLRLLRQELAGRVPLIGFSGSPWTLAVYMIEGGSSRDFYHARSMLYRNPRTVHALLNHLSDAIHRYLNAQIEAGAQVIMLFDSWGGLLGEAMWQDFSLQYMRRVLHSLHREFAGVRIPRIVFSRGGGLFAVSQLARSGCDAVGLDWTADLASIRRGTHDSVALQGNMDPAVLCGDPRTIRDEVARVLASYGVGSGHVFNLGHGISQFSDPDHVAVLVDAVHELSIPYHSTESLPDSRAT